MSEAHGTATIDRDTTRPLVSVRNVTKTFRQRGGNVHALQRVDLDIGRGEFVSLLGPSGCGKSTLLRIIGGLHEASSGVVTVNGLDADAARAAKQYGLVPQAPALVPWKTLGQNVRFLTGLHRGAHAHPVMSDAEINGLLETVGLAAFTKAYPHELSGGMQQRASLVRAFALGAPILLMDEPFAALDEQTRMTMGDELLRIWAATGKTVVFVTHSLTEAVYLADEVVVMSARPGRIVDQLQVSLPRPRTYEMLSGDAFGALRERIWRHIRKSA
jgi:NitT/TauT family transport system ATP-binding protein